MPQYRMFKSFRSSVHCLVSKCKTGSLDQKEKSVSTVEAWFQRSDLTQLCPDLLGSNDLPRLMLSNAGKGSTWSSAAASWRKGTVPHCMKTFEYLSDRQQTTADVLIKIKHHHRHGRSILTGKKKKNPKQTNWSHTWISGEFPTWVILFKLIF